MVTATQSPPDRGIQEVKTEAAMFVIPRTESHTLSLPQFPTGHTGYPCKEVLISMRCKL